MGAGLYLVVQYSTVLGFGSRFSMLASQGRRREDMTDVVTLIIKGLLSASPLRLCSSWAGFFNTLVRCISMGDGALDWSSWGAHVKSVEQAKKNVSWSIGQKERVEYVTRAQMSRKERVFDPILQVYRDSEKVCVKCGA